MGASRAVGASRAGEVLTVHSVETVLARAISVGLVASKGLDPSTLEPDAVALKVVKPSESTADWATRSPLKSLALLYPDSAMLSLPLGNGLTESLRKTHTTAL